ncbi:MAG: hypothetical protein PVH68_14350 [Armatimonadota bacterium]|jgi:hypothetical protein
MNPFTTCRSCTPIIVACTLTTCAVHADLSTQKLNALLSASETKSDDSSAWTVAWNLDGQWIKPGKHRSLTITTDSDFSKSGSRKLDRLRLAFRSLDADYGKVPRKWYSVYLGQTEGGHDFDSIHTLLAAGYRQKRKYGFIELTAGFSKDIRKSGEDWVGDVGGQFGYERELGRWKFRTGPKGEFGTVGDVRVRGDRLRWSWDLAVDYRATKKLGVGYRLWQGNTVPNATRTQWIGITYNAKQGN